MTTATAPDLVLAITGFAHALRDAGVAADRVRLTTSLQALAHVDVMDAEAVYWVARLTLCSEPDDLPRFDALFDLWFRGRIPARNPYLDPAGPKSVVQRPVSAVDGAGEQAAEDQVLASAASDAEVLQHRDVATLDDLERKE